ncbi:MAG: hypothetical protein A3C36_06045 [Omnitrophica WOR_2 bacterium RIFCSPHIGHO2_02_FULL_52_10]|nr:MAG: hypothetical protein A3C36_06045 [Omnitrophica WOR_2 bacterium RIFCSPHIGHO2_02_FULL_52_10]
MHVILSAKSVYPFHPVGGVQKYVYYFAKHLAAQGVDLEIVAPLDNGKPKTECYDGLKYRFLSPSIYRYLEYPVGWMGVHMFSRSLNQYLQTAKFDLLHSFDLTGYRYVRNERRRPVIAHIFTDNYLSNPISMKNPLSLLHLTGSKFERIKETKVKISPFADKATKMKYWAQYLFKIKPMYQCLKRSEAIFYEADIFQEDVNSLYRLTPQKSAVIPVGVDIPFIQKSIAVEHVSREEMGFSQKDIILITVNRLAADKGVDKIVLALERIVRDMPQVKLIIVGSGYQEKEISDLIDKKSLNGHVLHLKDIPEDSLYQYYDIADIYVSAFSYPGSSISTLEAMACALPVITTAQPWLVRGGGNGVFLESNRPERIADAVLRMIRGNRLKEQGNVSRNIVEEFSWDRIARKAVKQYEEVLRRYGQNG